MARSYGDFEHRDMVLVSPAEKWQNDFAGVPEKSLKGMGALDVGGLFDNLLKNLGTSVTGAVTGTVLQDPSAQAAIQQQLQNQVIQATAQQQLSFVQTLNKYKMYLFLGAALVAGVAIYTIARKKQ